MVRMPLIAVLLTLCSAIASAQNPPPPPDAPEPDERTARPVRVNPGPDEEDERPVARPKPKPRRPIEKTGTRGDPEVTARSLGATGSEVPDLKLPKSFEADFDDMFVDVTAECKGPVTWLVVSTSEKIKYKLAKEGDPVVTVGIPPRECVISVFCVGFVEGRFTNWARTDIFVHAQNPQPPPEPAPAPQPAPAPGPQPQPQPMPIPVGSRLQYTIIEDPRARTFETKSIIESPTVRQAIGATNVFRVKDAADPLVATFLAFLQKRQVGLPALFVQINDGTRTPKPPLWFGPLPRTEAEMVALVQRLQGGR